MRVTNKRRLALTLSTTLTVSVSSFSVLSASATSLARPASPSHSFSRGLVLLAEKKEEENSEPENSLLEEELESLQNQLSLIEALEERNKSQLESFVDEQDQWDSMEEEERELLLQKDAIVERMGKLAEELVRFWMGAKSMDG